MKHIIKKILKEENLKQNLKQQIKDFGIKDASKLVDGVDNLFKTLNIESPMDFLHLFDSLDQVQSKENPDWTLFRYKPKNTLMVYNRKNKKVYIKYYGIWSVLENHFGLKFSEIQRLTQEWLSEVYKLREVTNRNIYYKL
jgi:hypothetical protein